MNGLYDLAYIDPLTGPMQRQYFAEKKKENFDKFRDYAIEPMNFIEWCNKEMNFHTVIILGHPGVGKTSLLETLIDDKGQFHYKPMVFHMDSKTLPSIKLQQTFGTHKKPGEHLRYYDNLADVKKSLTGAKNAGLLDEFFTVFVTGHLDTKISLDDPREKMKIVGAMLNRADPESWVSDLGIVRNPSKNDPRYIEWEKDDTSPSRRTRGLFPESAHTPANLKLIMDEYQQKLRPLYV